jgi:rRNA maturation endonuclease Nob1
MSDVRQSKLRLAQITRRCLGCSATYPADEHACPRCGSHAAEVEEKTEAKPKRKT